ncbi:conserved hypothetical protein [Vibrio chagasii]|nr:conserved hypothetical protein [Vibrio chagasii]CAH6813254.1 conserved hypothetical protein [Vibrio chagasii]CAH6837041.1 conserved hypothetical protein [Vibrio chagasii]CAH6840687.1 conserved hypothetical protein [Vibrio chagasii]CAH6846893.1 conserved hypothetical protein [Vibrio chagasii]
MSILILLLTIILQLSKAQLQLFVKLMLNFEGLRSNFVHNNIIRLFNDHNAQWS